MSKQKVTVGQLLNLYDPERQGNGMTVKISEKDGEWSILQTNSILLKLIEYWEVDSVSGDEDGLMIWLSDNDIAECEKRVGSIIKFYQEYEK